MIFESFQSFSLSLTQLTNLPQLNQQNNIVTCSHSRSKVYGLIRRKLAVWELFLAVLLTGRRGKSLTQMTMLPASY